MVMQNSGGGGGVNKVHFGVCKSSESYKYLKAFNIVISVKQIIFKSNNSKCAVAY